jgi:hypothetical protein
MSRWIRVGEWKTARLTEDSVTFASDGRSAIGFCCERETAATALLSINYQVNDRGVE